MALRTGLVNGVSWVNVVILDPGCLAAVGERAAHFARGGSRAEESLIVSTVCSLVAYTQQWLLLAYCGARRLWATGTRPPETFVHTSEYYIQVRGRERGCYSIVQVCMFCPCITPKLVGHGAKSELHGATGVMGDGAN